MTTFMKIEVIIYYLLRVFGYICGFLGAFGVIGVAGSLECDTITIAQFWMYEIHSFMLIGVCYIVYYIRECVKEDFQRRERILKRRRARARKQQLAYVA